MLRLSRGVALFCALLVLSGCPDENSEFIDTDAIYFQFDVHETAGEATVSAQAAFFVGSTLGTPLELTSGDRISVNDVVLQEGILSRYFGTVPQADQYTYTFERDGESPYVSTGIPPAPVTITGPASGTALRYGTTFSVDWAASEDPESTVEISVRGGCFNQTYRDVLDNGHFDFAISTPEPPQEPCAAEVTITRTASFALDGNLDGRLALFTTTKVPVTVGP